MKIVVSKANFGGRNSVKWHNLFEKDPRGEVGYYYFTDQSMSSEPVHELRERGVSVAEINFNNCIIDHPLGNLEYQKKEDRRNSTRLCLIFCGVVLTTTFGWMRILKWQ